MGPTTKPTRQNRTITVDFHDESTYFQLLSDGKAFVELILAFMLSIGSQLTHKATCTGGGCLGWATTSMQCAPRMVGTRRANAGPEGLTARCSKCASGGARLQRGASGSSWLRRRLVPLPPGRGRAHPAR